ETDDNGDDRDVLFCHPERSEGPHNRGRGTCDDCEVLRFAQNDKRRKCLTLPNLKPSPPASRLRWTFHPSSDSFGNSGNSRRNRVCCEQISIHASGSRVAHLAGALLPLLESDLPTVLWWNGVFLDRPELFRRIGAVADRVLFDTSAWPRPEAQLSGLAKIFAD